MFKRRKRKTETQEIGQDSFLDVVSNIVGILIILVMITGVRLGRSSSNNVEKDDAKISNAAQELENRKSDLLNSQANVAASLEEQDEIIELLKARELQQNAVMDKLSSAEAAIEIASQEWSEKEKAAFQLNRQKSEIDSQLSEAKRLENWLSQQKSSVTVIENLPTPLAKDVQTGEAHFRLLGGKISHVPFPILFEKMVGDVRRRENFFQKIQNPEFTDKVGPLDGYELEYKISKRSVSEGPYGAGGTRVMIALDYCEMKPQSDAIGESIDDALKEGSAFLKHLSQYRSDLYTITIWVYPDSFTEFRKIREFLFQNGYLTAARPLKNGMPISGSPNGTKSSAL